ncbi:ATP-dependent zinc metalloprotease FtsH [Oxobacter pfennigii]|uniref:ATP-dependent zinc metalloprotease FtsH n=1 Tax=Oxobacter pfennigii TaxID=36849 RepID=A0A0P8Y812_9CLOT|nr:ATP-dependent zinc metalloprotease FtsH [Oxobacter pfennigii]KPU42758.1 ATP-dependent zinc metalloprotease FtsH [Oxobacter pfennigii]
MRKMFRSASLWILIILIVFLAANVLGGNNKPQSEMTKGEVIAYVKQNQVEKLDIYETKVTGTLKSGEEFNVLVLDGRDFYKEVQEIKAQYNIPDSALKVAEFPTQPLPFWVSMLPTAILVVLIVAFWFIFLQQSQGGNGGRGVMSFGKSRARMVTSDKKRVTFDDVAGADEEKGELEEIVDFLKQPRRYIELGARIPKGVLLVGPPGTGKTLLAKAVAGEAGVPFFSISGSDFVEMFVGVGASRVRDLFEQAKKNSPSIVFIDEIDAVGRQRGAGLGGGHDEREQTLNQLLVEMDGFGVNEGVIIIAATNRPDILDPALLRPGRFDRQILVGVPDIKGREEILKVHSKGKPLAEEVNLSTLAKRTPGFTGADLENLMNEAALLSVRRGKKSIGMQELEESITRVLAGPEKKSRVMSEKERKLTAFHEAGHAVVMKLLPNADPVHQVSIIPRGRAGGYTLSLPQEDKHYASKLEITDEIVGLLGGRAAEKLVLDDISTGATNDIDRATGLARKMVTEFGMSDRLGPMTFGSAHDEVFLGRDFTRSRNYSEEVAAQIDKEIRVIIEDAYHKAETLLKENINRLHRVAEALLEREKLEADEFEEVFNMA